ncbi:hypothetical protein [Sphingomonas sp. TREG-RG-20F-R18-01]|uniref:hypothetical protein n=1 Tax=Sphingomonas sp. TREG-RG-20F-R18-01 TaxID=2914982 RepID=UPI001F58D114|nr:hypothetical protein [Sphingomonas sp. TREG-RG-20F-R18-01]
MLDVRALAQATAAVVRELVPAMLEKATAPLLERIAQLEARKPEPGKDGKDVDIDELASMINRAVAAIEIPAPQPGNDGKDVDMDEVRSLILAAVADLPPAQPGKDADPELVRSLVAEAVDAIVVPEAKPGNDGKDVDMDEVRSLIVAAVADLPPAQPGKDADPALVRSLVAEAVAAIEIPAAKDGKDVDVEQVCALVQSAVDALPPAQPGRDADPELVRSAVAAAIAAIELPQPRDGKNVDPAVVRALVDEAVAALPPPAPGKSITVDEVAPLIREEVAKSVAAIPRAKDGVGAAGAVIDRSGSLVLTLSDGKMVDLGRVDGKDGLDGTGPEDMTVELMPDGRTVKFVFAKGEKEYAFQVPFPVVLDRGVFKEGTAYEHGDAVTFGGSLWIAQRATGEKPEGTNTGWRLAVKKGRDGRDLSRE